MMFSRSTPNPNTSTTDVTTRATSGRVPVSPNLRLPGPWKNAACVRKSTTGLATSTTRLGMLITHAEKSLALKLSSGPPTETASSSRRSATPTSRKKPRRAAAGCPFSAGPQTLRRTTRFMNTAPTDQKTRSALNDVVTREYTVHLHKRVHGASFKKSEPQNILSDNSSLFLTTVSFTNRGSQGCQVHC
ncbi:MAG: hypothetical protein EOO72_08840 [Myxococcaceae bacterium]|nr:MAG: hypothetical protein EOO72_08840 [Myxococcaceae bacterium]